MHRVNFFAVATLSMRAVLLVALGTSFLGALQGTAQAQQAQSAKLQLSEVKNSGVSGTAVLRDVEDGVEVALSVQGLPEEGVEHLNHFHGGGTCSDVEAGENVPITIPLDPIVANEDGTGSATTTIKNVTLEQLFDRSQDRVILLHDEAYTGEGLPPAIACADVNAASGEQTMMKESTQRLPSSGGTSAASFVLPSAALLMGVGVLAYALVRRR